MDEDSAKSVKVRAPRHGHKHKSKKSPPMSPEATLRIISRDALDDCDKENPAQLLEQLRKFPDDDPPDRDDSKLDPREAHDADNPKDSSVDGVEVAATGRDRRRSGKRNSRRKNLAAAAATTLDSSMKEGRPTLNSAKEVDSAAEAKAMLSGSRALSPAPTFDEIVESVTAKNKESSDQDDPTKGGDIELSGPPVNETLGETAARLHNMLKIHHMKKPSPTPSPDDTPGRTRPLRQPKHDLQEETPKGPATDRIMKRGKSVKGKERAPTADSFLTELDAPVSDPVQPPIIRQVQQTPATLSKSSQSSNNNTSSDRKVCFNLDRNLMTHCSATRPQNNFYGKPNQKRKQELRNIAYSSRSESAKKEGALDFDPKEKSNQQTRRATKRSSRAKRAPATGKQGRAGKMEEVDNILKAVEGIHQLQYSESGRTRKMIQGKGNVIIASANGIDERFYDNDDSDANEFAQMLTKATNSCKIN